MKINRVLSVFLSLVILGSCSPINAINLDDYIDFVYSVNQSNEKKVNIYFQHL